MIHYDAAMLAVAVGVNVYGRRAQGPRIVILKRSRVPLRALERLGNSRELRWRSSMFMVSAAHPGMPCATAWPIEFR
jgi:hypothetical protein